MWKKPAPRTHAWPSNPPGQEGEGQDIIRNGKLFFTNAVDVYRMIDQARKHNATKLGAVPSRDTGRMESDEGHDSMMRNAR